MFSRFPAPERDRNSRPRRAHKVKAEVFAMKRPDRPDAPAARDEGPYRFQVGETPVKLVFSRTGPTLEEALARVLARERGTTEP